MGGNQLGFTCREVGTAVEDGSASKVSSRQNSRRWTCNARKLSSTGTDLVADVVG